MKQYFPIHAIIIEIQQGDGISMDDGKEGLLKDSAVNNTTFPITRIK